MIAVIDYNMGNLFSVVRALEQAGGEVRVIENPAELAGFAACVLPGVGNFGQGMEELRSRGFESAIRKHAAQHKPLLGICMGMQMLLDSSEEAPGVAGLGLIPGRVVGFPASATEKVPHMGWNQIHFPESNPLFSQLADGEYFYFVHSFYAEVAQPADAWGICRYGRDFAAIVGHGKLCGVQFHPEKSQKAGLKLLENFIHAQA